MSGDAVEALRQLDGQRLAAALFGEHPRTVSMVLNSLETDKAGEVLKRLRPETRRDVSLRLSQTARSGPDVLQHIARALLKKSGTLRDAPAKPDDGAKYKRIADMLRLLDKPDRMEILAALQQGDGDTAAKIKDHLYHFDDLMVIEDRSMQKLLTEIDTRNLALALKTASEEINEKVQNNLSKRARESLAEEMEFMSSVPSAQIQQAQKMIVDVIQRLDQAGELVMKEG